MNKDIELIREAADYMDYGVDGTNVTDVTDRLRAIADRRPCHSGFTSTERRKVNDYEYRFDSCTS